MSAERIRAAAACVVDLSRPQRWRFALLPPEWREALAELASAVGDERRPLEGPTALELLDRAGIKVRRHPVDDWGCGDCPLLSQDFVGHHCGATGHSLDDLDPRDGSPNAPESCPLRTGLVVIGASLTVDDALEAREDGEDG